MTFPAPAGQLASSKAPALLSLLVLALALIFPAPALATALLPALAQQTLWSGPVITTAPQPQRTPSTPIGTLPSSFTVTDHGSARYTVPLDLPPAALTPAVTLEYDSQQGDGPLGMGWSLSGLSSLHRCPKTLADDDIVEPVRIDDADPLCLDGARLKLISGTHLHPGAVYRPKRDDLSRVTIISGSPDGALICDSPGFEVRRADGTIDLYGCRRDAVALHPLGPAAWSLSRRSDRFGNYVDYRYGYDHQAGADVERWLTAIDYGGHPTHAPVRHLRLTWEQRPDPHHGWMLGAPVHQTKRLAALETFSQGELVHRYELDYDTPTITGRSLLHALRQCDALGVCRPDTTFSWEPGELAFADITEGENFELFQSWPFLDDPNNDADDVYQAGVLAQTILDANGDGRSDLLLAAGQNGLPPAQDHGWELWTSQPHALTQGGLCGSAQDNFLACQDSGRYIVWESPRTGILAGPGYDDLGQAPPPLFAADIDGDGRDDAIALGDDAPLFGGLPPAGHRLYLIHGGPEGVTQQEFDPGTGVIWQLAAADFTGDGLTDLLFCSGEPQADTFAQPVDATGRWHLLRNVPNQGFTQEQVQPLKLPCTAYDKLLLLDHDGDGLTSLLTIPVWNPENHDWLPSAKWPSYHALRPDEGTLEDTGLPPDYAQRWRPHVVDTYNLSSLDDDFPKALQGYGLDKILDVNGDGLPDILRYQLDIGDAQENLGVIMQTIVVDDPPLPEHGGLRLWLNTGAGFADGG